MENKRPDVNIHVKKTIYDTKISDLEKKLTDHNHGKYITNPEFNTLAADVFNTRLAQANLMMKTDFDAKLSSLNRKITSYKSFDSSYFIFKTHFEEGDTQNYFIIPANGKTFYKDCWCW